MGRARETENSFSTYFSSQKHATAVGRRIDKLRILNGKNQIANFINTTFIDTCGQSQRRSQFAPNALNQYKVNLVETRPVVGLSLYHQEKARATTPGAVKVFQRDEFGMPER